VRNYLAPPVPSGCLKKREATPKANHVDIDAEKASLVQKIDAASHKVKLATEDQKTGGSIPERVLRGIPFSGVESSTPAHQQLDGWSETSGPNGRPTRMTQQPRRMQKDYGVRCGKPYTLPHRMAESNLNPISARVNLFLWIFEVTRVPLGMHVLPLY